MQDKSTDSILSGFYPFAGDKAAAAVPTETSAEMGTASFGLSDETLAAAMQQKVEESVQVKLAYFKSQEAKLLMAAKCIADVYRGDSKMFSMGNGGSSCDASHLAVEFLHPITAGRPALPAINLGADSTMITAASNDLGFNNAFVRQLIAQARSGDVLVGFSTSGCSENLMQAFSKAKELKMHTIGFAGMDGGVMAKSPDVDICLVVDSMSIHRIQESHLTTYHILWDLVHSLLADDRKKQVGK
ncbi:MULTISPECIES: D-sedoheptulose-7-phosphate isomerase [Thiomicrorhabdus]|nr:MULTISPECIES: SIS domain-containing protein [Thiomicrorhabdus]